MVLCLGAPPRRFLLLLLLYLHFIFVSSFYLLMFFILSIFFILLLFFIHIYFSTSSLPLPWTIAGFLHPFYTFSPAHRKVIHDTFIFQLFRYLLTASATVLSGHFLPTGVFYLTLLHRYFNLHLSRLLPWEPAVLP